MLSQIVVISLLFIIKIFFIIAINSIKINKASKLWLTLFLSIWFIVQVICLTNIYELQKVEVNTYIILNIFVFIYVFGFLLNIKKLNIKLNQNKFKIKIAKITNDKKYILIFALVSIIVSYYFYKYFVFMVEAPLTEARKARFYTGYVFQSGIEQILFNTFLSVIVNFLMLLSIIAIKQKISKYYINILAVITAIGWNGFGGGRFDLLILIYMFIFSAIVLNQNKNLIERKNNNLIMIVVVIAAMLIAIITTSFRTGGSIDFDIIGSIILGFNVLIEQIITYFNGSIIAFQYAVDKKEIYYYPGYGMFIVSGCDELISLALNFIGFSINPFNYNFTEIMDRNIYIGNGFEFNALYTALFYGYMDLNILGVMILGLLLGYGSSLSINKFYTKGKISNIIIAWVMFITSMLTPVVLKLTSPDMVLMLIGAILINLYTSKNLSKNLN